MNYLTNSHLSSEELADRQQRIKALIGDGFSKSEIARSLGISRQRVSQIANGRISDGRHRCRVCGETGHRAPTCPKAPRRVVVARRVLSSVAKAKQRARIAAKDAIKFGRKGGNTVDGRARIGTWSEQKKRREEIAAALARGESVRGAAVLFKTSPGAIRRARDLAALGAYR